MSKKLTNILRTNVTLYFICLVLFALAAIPFDVRLAIGEGAAAVVLLIIARQRSQLRAAEHAPVHGPLHQGHGLRPVQQHALCPASHDGVRHGHPGRGRGATTASWL